MGFAEPDAPIVYVFTSKFRDKIRVSTNVSDYNFMRSVVSEMGSTLQTKVRQLLLLLPLIHMCACFHCTSLSHVRCVHNVQ
jgi:hypothetical protein